MKTIIITGANGNLGTACVKTFLQEGHRVIAVDGHDHHLSFAKDNKSFSFYSVDLADEAASASFIEAAIASYGRIDGALLLVGAFAPGNMATTSGTDLQQMFSANFNTAYFIARPLLGHLIENNYGRLVFIGARPALVDAQGKDLLAYALSKSLLFRLAAFINESVKGKNISAGVVVPSTIDTPINRQSMPTANPADWVSPDALAGTMAFIFSAAGEVLRETVLKVYNNA